MQVARLMRPKPRTWLNKALETLLALKIELYRHKDEILSSTWITRRTAASSATRPRAFGLRGLQI